VILPDTSAWIDYLNGANTTAVASLRRALAYEDVIVGDLILAEVLQGIRHERDVRTAAALLYTYPVQTLCGAAIAEEAAANYRFLRRQGLTIRGTIDVIVATWCIAAGVRIIHNDRDLAAMEVALGLQRYE
jgi:predicted nucleic acid-binding protein